MSVDKNTILAALAAVKSPEGVALPATGKLSDVIVTDGKVFFSITVDAAWCPPGSPCARPPRWRSARCPVSFPQW